MPYQMWVHTCREEKWTKVWWIVEVCPNCGKHGTYDGWYYSTFEKMAAYRRSTGIVPFGPHRVFADQLLGSRMKACKRCKGRGLLNTDHGSGWISCPHCEGAGYIFRGSQTKFESLRERITGAYPGIWNNLSNALRNEMLPDPAGTLLISPNGKHPNTYMTVKAKKVRARRKKGTGVKGRLSKPLTRPIRKRAQT